MRHQADRPQPAPRGASGVITMKLMISTSSTSIIGVTLICAFCPLPPMFMLMVDWTAAKVRKFPVGGGRT